MESATPIRTARSRSRARSNLMDRSDWVWVAWICGGALFLRLAFVLLVQRDETEFNATLSDPAVYHAIAKSLANGTGFTGINLLPTAQFPPSYPFLLSLVYRVFGEHPLSGTVFNAFMGAATVGFAYLIARRALGRTAARFSAIGLAVMPGQIFYTDVIFAEILATLLLVGLVYVCVARSPERWWTAIWVGVLIGVSTLTRGEGPLLVVFPLVRWWPLLSRRDLVKKLAVVVAAAALCVIPWTIRNASAMHEFIPVSTNGGTTIWSGHNPGANGSATYIGPDLAAKVNKYPPEEREVRLNSMLQSDALSYAFHNPGRELALIPLRFLELNRGDSAALSIWIIANDKKRVLNSNQWRRLGTLADFAWFALLAAFIASLFTFGRSLLRNLLLRAGLAYIGVSLVLYTIVLYGNFRYRAPAQPLMLFIAAPLAVRLSEIRRDRLGGS